MAEKELIKCPKCGGSSGFYHKYIQSHTQFIGFDGKPLDNSAEVVRGGTKIIAQTVNVILRNL